MSIKILSVFLFVFVILNLVSCSDDPSKIGKGFLINSDLIKLDSLDSYKDTFPQFSYTYKHSIPLGYSSNLLLGQKGDNVATMLLNFNIVVPDSIKTELLNNTLTISSATVQLYKSYTYGDSLAPIDYSVHSISSATGWTSDGFTIDSLPQIIQNMGAADVSSNKSFTDTLYQFNITNDLALNWLNIYANSQSPDNGIVVIPNNSGKIVGFYGLTTATTVDIPFLIVVLNKPGYYNNDTLKFSTTADLSVVSGKVPQNPNDNIYIQSSVELESRIRFDLSKIPAHSIINYAELQLTIDTTQSLFGSTYTDQLTASFINDTTYIDSLSTNQVTLNRTGSLYTGNVTSYVQNWLSTKINYGMEIRASVYDTGVELWTLKGSNADPSKRPRLKIIYTNNK
ncbi:MAG: DNRLRE domain-containing protein [Ignavibacteriaceae bacterium]|nr:DNRLRE domain-containing protein [Ignavibacteriaceae bacterium]